MTHKTDSLGRSLLLLVLLRFGESLLLKTLNEMTILPAKLIGQVAQADVGTIRSILRATHQLYLK